MTMTVLHPPVLTEIERMTLDGDSAAHIARELGIGKRTVEEGRRMLGIHGTNPGWRGGDTFVDEMAVVRAMDGDRVRCTPYETREAVRRLTERGHSSAWIANRLGVSSRTVVRHRNAIDQGKATA